MKIITIASIKGGVGKSSLCINISHHLSKLGKTLAIDTDPQNSLTDYLLRETEIDLIIKRNITGFFRGQVEFNDIIHQVEENLYCIPSTIDMATIGKELGNKPSAIFTLHDILKGLDFDYIVIDTPPSIDFPLHCAIMAAELILIPFNPSRWTMRGVEIMNNEINEIERIKKSRPKIMLIPYMVTNTENEIIAGTSGFSQNHVPRSVSVRHAVDTGKPIKEGSVMWNIFASLTKEIVEYAG